MTCHFGQPAHKAGKRPPGSVCRSCRYLPTCCKRPRFKNSRTQHGWFTCRCASKRTGSVIFSSRCPPPGGMASKVRLCAALSMNWSLPALSAAQKTAASPGTRIGMRFCLTGSVQTPPGSRSRHSRIILYAAGMAIYKILCQFGTRKTACFAHWLCQFGTVPAEKTGKNSPALCHDGTVYCADLAQPKYNSFT